MKGLWEIKNYKQLAIKWGSFETSYEEEDFFILKKWFPWWNDFEKNCAKMCTLIIFGNNNT
jgi:hypothetical protein